MASHFAWIDVDESSRRSMLNFIDQFRDQGTLDELGIGAIRDAFADFFFPGTTTVQTRARYFLFVPWIYQYLERRQISSLEMAKYLKKGELDLLEAMKDAGVGEGERLIGRQSGAALQRWPSNIYWAGLGAWGIRQFDGSQERYHRWLDTYHLQRKKRSQDAEFDGATAVPPNWDPNLPAIPEDFPDGSIMDLRVEDAEYLVHRIRMNCPDSMLTALLRDKTALDAPAVWLLPRLSELPALLTTQINHARWFATLIHGANLQYYWQLAKLANHEDRAATGEKLLRQWVVDLSQEWDGFMAWSKMRNEFWASAALREARVPDRARRFVNSWIDLAVKLGPTNELYDSNAAAQLIKDRERETKGEARARLWNRRQLERWDPIDAPGLLEYRWGIASWIIGDIQSGLGIRPRKLLEESGNA
jgi:hypothetical protein